MWKGDIVMVKWNAIIDHFSEEDWSAEEQTEVAKVFFLAQNGGKSTKCIKSPEMHSMYACESINYLSKKRLQIYNIDHFISIVRIFVVTS